ncbi:MAG: DUF3291 domain-containing protein [Corynebacteriales bacterium]|nr:DUF3291 domain-containing protein [Mycobacteriales bacterium]
MPKLPWSAIDVSLDPQTPVVVMASEFKLASHLHIPAFFRDSLKIRSQVLKAPGAVGMSLDAQIFAKTFRTLSAWRDRKVLNALVKAEPHYSAMARHRPHMADSTFVFWEMPAGELPVKWDEATARLSA